MTSSVANHLDIENVEELTSVSCDSLHSYTFHMSNIQGHLLTSFSTHLQGNLDKFSTWWKATLFIGPRVITSVNVRMTERRKIVQFFREESTLLLPAFLLKTWPIKITLECLHNDPLTLNATAMPRMFVNTRSLDRSVRKKIQHEDIEIVYWPRDAIAVHQLRVVRTR